MNKKSKKGRKPRLVSPTIKSRAAIEAESFSKHNILNRRDNKNRRAPENILQIAEGLIYGPRNKVYKHPTENFNNIANLWNAYFEAIKVRPDVVAPLNTDPWKNEHYGFKINKIDVAYMNILQKIARGATAQDHEDTVVDIAGYAGCIERVLKNK